MDFNRQVNLLNPSSINYGVTIIGCGATGSEIAMQLVQMGVGDDYNGSELILYDGDVVKEHNLPNQIFLQEHIEMNKAEALKDIIQKKVGNSIKVKAIPEMFDYELDTINSKVVFLLTDTMKSRQEIYRSRIKNNINIEMLFETRMGLRTGMIHSLDPRRTADTDRWEQTLYSDEEASDSETTACGTSQTANSTAKMISTMVVGQWVQWHRESYEAVEKSVYYNEIHLLSLYPPQFYLNPWNGGDTQITAV